MCVLCSREPSEEAYGALSPLSNGTTPTSVEAPTSEVPMEESTLLDEWLHSHFAANGVMLPSHPFVPLWELLSECPGLS